MAQVEFEVPGPGTYLIDADPSLPALSNPGQASDVLSREQFYDEDGNPVTGTMPNNPAEAVVIPGGSSYTIPQGYHTGQGTVTSSGSALPTLTNPAAAGEIASGKEVIDQNGAVMTGTMPSNPAISETLEAGESYQVPAGYTPGGTVQAASLASQTPGTATQDDIIQGQTAWVNGVQITGALEPGSDTSDATATAADILEGETAYVATGKVSGTMPNNGAVQQTLQAGGQYTIPEGYHNGQGKVTAESLANQTQGTATAPDILDGKTAWVNGAQVTGSMPDNGAVTKEMTAGETYNIPAGYHNGSGTVTAPTVASETPGTAVAEDIRQGKTAWVDGEQLTGTVPDVEAATPTISVDSQTGLITAETQQTEGFVGEATKAASQQLPVQGAQTITPSTTAQTIQAQLYLIGSQTILGDEALLPENIKDGISIFGVVGTYEGGGSGSFAIPLTVSIDTGATVTAVNGETTLTTTSVNNTANFILTSGGVWTITAELDGESVQGSVPVQESYSLILRFPSNVTYYGQATPLSQGRNSFAGGSAVSYAMFGGGKTQSNYNSYIVGVTNVDSYNAELTLTNPDGLSTGRFRLSSARAGTYVLFAGGVTEGDEVNTVDAYDGASLTRTTATSLQSSNAEMASATVNNCAIFFCGSGSWPTVESYDASLVRSSLENAPLRGLNSLAGISFSNYALFGGGIAGSYSGYGSVFSYDLSLTRTQIQDLSVARGYLGGAVAGSHALFAGGWYSPSGSASDTEWSDTVDAYDESLTRTVVESLSAKRQTKGASIGGQAIFGPGVGESYQNQGTAYDIYNESLTRTTYTGASRTGDYAVASIGNYALFAGGGATVNTVEVFTV